MKVEVITTEEELEVDITLTLIIIHKISQAITKVKVYAVEEHHIGLIHIDLSTRDTAVGDRIMD